MKIACTYHYEKKWIDEAVRLGFSYMEISSHLLPSDEVEEKDVINYALNKGLKLSIHAPYGSNNISSSDDQRRDSSVANVKKAIDISAKYNLGAVTFHPGRLSDDFEKPEENMPRLMEVVADIANYAKEKKVFVGIENMELRPYELIFTVDDLNLFAPFGKENPYFGVTIDFAHYSSHNIGLPDLSKLKLPIHNIHLSQNVNGKTHRGLHFEEGLLNLKDVCRSIKNYGYDGHIVLEVGDFVQESREKLLKVLSEI